MKKLLCILTIMCLGLLVASSQAYWTGGGDGTSWGDVDNWSEDIVPLTDGGADTATVNANAAVTNVNIDAATANTFVDSTSGNFLSSRAQTAGQTLNLTADWDDGFTGGGMWVGQSTAGIVNFNSNAGAFTVTGATYIGRSSISGGEVNLNVNGGTVALREPSIGCRSDALADCSLNVTGGTLYMGQTGPEGQAGTIMGRSQHGAYNAGQTAKVSISGDATVVMNDVRLGGLIDGDGTNIFEVIGSNATITFDHNYFTQHQSTYYGDRITRFVADAGGVSTITAYDPDATLRIDGGAILQVDVSAYEGNEDLVLFSYNRHVGGTYGTVEITDTLERGARLVYKNTGATYDNTNVGRIYLTFQTAGGSTGATDPLPASDVSVELPRDVDLSWTPDPAAVYHNLYLGTIYTDVKDADTSSQSFMGELTDTSFDCGLLKRGYTYYWRVDELDSDRELLSKGEIWSFKIIMFDPDDLGPVTYLPDWSGIRNIPSAPPVGVHPRIYFGPDEIPDLKHRLANTACGREAMKQIYAYVKLLEVGNGGYNRTASYAVDDYGNPRIGNVGLYDSKIYYDKLAAGTANALDGTDATRLDVLVGNIAISAFYYFINDDIAGQEKAAAALTGFVAYSQHTTVHFVHIAYAYDMLYNQMTVSQRDTVRAAIRNIVNGHKHYGTYTEAYATTGNWTSLDFFWPVSYMAIEGETDLDPITYDSAVRANRNFLTYGWYDDGAGWEGLGKNYQWVTALAAFARRGEDLIAHPHVRAYGERFLPALMQPFGYAFSSYDAWGGSGDDQVSGGYKFNSQDAIGLKWAFPDSEKIDFLWKNYVSYPGKEGTYNMLPFLPRGYDNSLLVAAVFSCDYEQGSWDSSVKPLTEFFDERGLVTTRSDYSSEAVGMQFHCRQNFGGHTHGDRNHFNLSGLGRTWGVYRTMSGGGETGESQETKYHSCLLIDASTTFDGYGIPLTYQDGIKARQPGKVLDFIDSNIATFATGNATYAYSWEYKWIPGERNSPDPSDLDNGWEKSNETLNDFRLEPGEQFYNDLPFYQFAHWLTYPLDERIIKRPSQRPMAYVYRTAGIIRGEKPYALVIDDARVANRETHDFWWQMQLPSYPTSGIETISIHAIDVNLEPQDYRCDIILKEHLSFGDRRLLVRVLQNEGHTGTPGFIHNRPEPRWEKSWWPALVVEAKDCHDPHFKVLLYPHYSGDPLPLTTWEGSKLTVTVGSQVDVYDFKTVAGEPTGFTMVRNGCSLLPYDGDINRDDIVNLIDYSSLARCWLECYGNSGLKYITNNWLK
jgi:hypothetical protein